MAPFASEPPPSFEACVNTFEADCRGSADTRLPIDRLFILGAGFSASFGFTTSATLVRGVMDFFAQYRLPSDWHVDHCGRLVRWLDQHHADWRQQPPDLISFAKNFFSDGLLANSGAIDPLALHDRRVSWEAGNFDPPDAGFSYRKVLLSFEALLCEYLYSGLHAKDVLVEWAKKFITDLTPQDVIVTTNWDVICEALLTQLGRPFSRYEWRADRVKLVKLHGSLDLLGVPNAAMRSAVADNHLQFDCVTPLTWRAVTAEAFHPTTGPLPFPFSRAILPWERFNKSAVLIMPPFYSLGYGYSVIQFNWRKARAALERARRIVVVGYSFSEYDRPLLQLITQVFAKREHGAAVVVWNPNPSIQGAAEKVFRSPVTFHAKRASEITIPP